MAFNEIARPTDYSRFLPAMRASIREYDVFCGLRLDPLLRPRAFAREQLEICKRRKQAMETERWMRPIPSINTDSILAGIDLDAAYEAAVAEDGAEQLSEGEPSRLVSGARFLELQHRRGLDVELEKALILGRGTRVKVDPARRPGRVATVALLGAMGAMLAKR